MFLIKEIKNGLGTISSKFLEFSKIHNFCLKISEYKYFYKTPMNKALSHLKCSIYLLNHHEIKNPLQTSFLCTNDADDKHNVLASQNKPFPCQSYIMPKQGY